MATSILLGALLCVPGDYSAPRLLLSAPAVMARRGDDFERAIEPRRFYFPRDHGNHPRFKTEWWYVTGALQDGDGNLHGFQATWFRSALVARPPARRSPLATRDLYFFHGSLTDVRARRFVFDHSAARGASSWAGSDAAGLRVFLLSHTLEDRGGGTWRLRFDVRGRRVDLELTPRREPLLHGANPGLSRKGAAPGQASYYVSRTRLEARGSISGGPGGERISVRGQAWFDHEFGSNQLPEEQEGWDWFSVALDDGTDLMLYVIRKKDGTVEPMSAGTLRDAAGARVHLRRDAFALEVLERWSSPRSAAEYPSRWRLRVPARRLELEVRPLVPDQELDTRGTTGVTYWEGLCEFTGQHAGRPVRGHGYVELVGYAGEFRAGI